MTDQFPQLLTQISLLDNRNSAAICSRLADTFENNLLNYEQFPSSYMDFFLALLSDQRYYTKPGIWNFILAVNNAKDALSAAQYETITAAFTENFADYRDKELCFAVCDFIARNLSYSKAATLLRTLKAQELQKAADLRGYADEGLFILEQEVIRASRDARLH